METVFKALADKQRRKILNIVKATPGKTLQEICTHFSFTRYAVMKHLRILEEANLVVRQRDGKYKRFYLNTIPFQMIYDRWLSEYTKFWSTQLTYLKYNLEQEYIMDKSELRQVYVVYIKTSKEKLWEAITSPKFTEQYFFHTRVTSDFKKGSEISYFMTGEDGNEAIPVKGKIIEIDPPNRLVHTFQHTGNHAGAENYSEPSRVVYEIEEMGDLVKLTLTHDEFKDDMETYKSVGGGWPMIVNSLKTFLETGKPLGFPSDN
jgi:uncharacterized protein YndB with AHSA1/START domain